MTRRTWLALVLVCACVCFARLGAAPIWVLNEAREGVYAREMLAQGDLVLPRVENHVENGTTLPDKPPLLHWIDCAERALRSLVRGRSLSGPALGEAFDVWDLRFASALAGLACALALASLGRGLVGARAALLATLALVTSAQFEHQSHFGRVDMCLAACVTLALLLLGGALLGGSRRALLGAAVASGLAVLSKGPLGLVLPASACATYLAWRSLREGGPRWVPRLPWLRAALVWLVVAVPWYLAAWRTGGQEFVRSQLLSENLAQFGGGNGRMDPLTYLGPWLSDTFPWNLVALAGLWRAWREKHEGARFAGCWWITILVLFQLAAYKRRAYLLPAVPAEALLAGFALDGWLARAEAAGARFDARGTLRRLGPAAALALGAGALLGFELARAGHAPRVAGVELSTAHCVVGCAGAALALAMLGAGALAWRARRVHEALSALFLGCAAVASLVLPVERIARAEQAGIPEFVARIERELPAGEPLTLIGVGDDPSLVLLFAAREPARWRVIADAAPPLQEFPPGWYLVHEREARALAAGAGPRCEGWREVLRGTLRERDNPRELVLLERRR